MTHLPLDFISMLHDLLGEEAEQLIESLNEPPITSVRLNRRKPGAEFEGAEKVPWCPSGLYLKERPEFIFDPLLHAGAYYVQDASSMIYETVVEILLKKFKESIDSDDSTEEDSHSSSLSHSGIGCLKVLDLCAAPGGKTTAMINALPDGSEIIANEYTPKRVASLRENIAKWGYCPVNVTNKDSAFYALQGEVYDIVAVDAPCSGEGMMRKEEMARRQWSHQLVEQCSILQKEILDNAIKCLKPGGFLIYSTCTFNRQENEENVEFLAVNKGLIPVNPDFPDGWGISEGIGTTLPVYRFMPHKTKGEGLFLAVLQKPGVWVPSYRKSLPPNKKEIDSWPEVEVDKTTALSYLRGESIILPSGSPKGLVTITFKGLPLGEAKNIGSRANNHYPKAWRILKR